MALWKQGDRLDFNAEPPAPIYLPATFPLSTESLLDDAEMAVTR